MFLKDHHPLCHLADYCLRQWVLYTRKRLRKVCSCFPCRKWYIVGKEEMAMEMEMVMEEMEEMEVGKLGNYLCTYHQTKV